MIKIEKGVPLPTVSCGDSLLPLGEMEVGDSFFLECANDARVKIQNNLSSRLRYFGKSHGMKFKTRSVDEKSKSGFRVWRVA